MISYITLAKSLAGIQTNGNYPIERPVSSQSYLAPQQTNKQEKEMLPMPSKKKTANQRSTATNVNKAFAANTASVYAINVENRKQLQWLRLLLMIIFFFFLRDFIFKKNFI